MNDASKNTQMPMVGVVMSTYNGEKFLAEQLDSILCQKGVDVRLVVRDDGSKDATVDILNRYAAQHGNMTVLARPNVGCKQSFCEAAREAADLLPDCDYFAFADQDDVWLDDKLASGVNALEKLDKKERQPLLYFCPPKLVDGDLNPLAREWPRHNLLTFREACIIQPCAGCTMVFNREALNLLSRLREDINVLHDAWLYGAVLACGGIVVEDEEPHILYRQHGHNVIGGNQSLRQKWTRRWNTFHKGKRIRSRRLNTILEVYGDLMPSENLRIARTLSSYDKNLWRKLRIIFSKEYDTRRSVINRLFRISVLFNKF